MAKKTSKNQIIDFQEIRQLLYENAETGFVHTTYQEETRRFLYLVNGDTRAITDSMNIMDPNIQGTLSKDPLRNMKYLFVVNTGLATRYLIEAGVPQETVYSTSDIYIQKADVAKSAEEVVKLNKEVWTVFVNLVREHKKKSLYSKTILDSLNYIDSHFNEKLTLDILAKEIGLNGSYLATLFKKETGKTFATYLTDIRIKTAQALLVRTEYTYSQIGYSVGFCSQSHFTSTFRKLTGYTPKEYRTKFFNTNISANILPK